jgi:hypothetical protein
VRGRGEIDGNDKARERPSGNCVHRKKFRDRKSGEPQQMPGGARAIIFANNFNSHGIERGRTWNLCDDSEIFVGHGFTGCGKTPIRLSF